MILSDYDIVRHMDYGNIIITPFDKSSLGTNSYDAHLSPHLMCYTRQVLDCKADNPTVQFDLNEDGYTLMPGTLYLAATIEYTETKGLVPCIEGKSSLARLGLFVHATAGFGDAGFTGHWTLEMTVVQPLVIYPYMPIGQLYWHQVSSPPDQPYNEKKSAKYNGQPGYPVASKMYMNFAKAVEL